MRYDLCGMCPCEMNKAVMTNTTINALDVQINTLKQQIDLEESNYRYAIELKKDYDSLLTLQSSIIEQKKILYSLIQEAKVTGK
jgi:hypothetical protein